MRNVTEAQERAVGEGEALDLFETSSSMKQVGALINDGEFEPIIVSVGAQVIGTWYAMRISPYEFQQNILQALKERGAPVEGTLHKRLAHGRLARLKSSPKGPGWFDYVWLPDNYVKALQLSGGLGASTT